MPVSFRKKYRILNGKEFDLSKLLPEEKAVFREVYEYFKTSPEWGDFSNFWRAKTQSLWADINRRKVVSKPLFVIFQDMGSRLGIEQGYVREEDYRDKLQKIIEENFGSWYKFCQETGVDEGFLSKILHKKRHFSMETLSQVLDKIGYEIDFSQKKHLRHG